VRTAGSGPNDVQSIGPQTDWRDAIEGVDAVFHLAASVHHPNEEHVVELYRSFNVEGPVYLARSAASMSKAAAEAGLKAMAQDHGMYITVVRAAGRNRRVLLSIAVNARRWRWGALIRTSFRFAHNLWIIRSRTDKGETRKSSPHCCNESLHRLGLGRLHLRTSLKFCQPGEG
jgi:hypothetical protein